jgi:hypothetical protein
MSTTKSTDKIIIPLHQPRFIDRLLHRFRKRTHHDKSAVLTKAFTVGGRTYYQHDDVFTKPYERAMTAIDYYEELRMCTSRDFQMATAKALRICLSGQAGKVDLVKATQLLLQFEQRAEWIFTPDLLYKLASVVFIDIERESPFTYDFQKAHEKIAFWKEHKDAAAFFLQTPFQELVPFLKGCEIDIPRYSKVVQKLQKSHLALLSSVISAGSNKSDSDSALLSRIEKQIALGDFDT